MEAMNNVEMHRNICEQLNKIYEKKNHDYGDSFHETFVEEGMAMARIRLSDKLNRFKRLSKLLEEGTEDEQKVADESIEDTLMDLANYAIMTVMEMRRESIQEVVETLAKMHENIDTAKKPQNKCRLCRNRETCNDEWKDTAYGYIDCENWKDEYETDDGPVICSTCRVKLEKAVNGRNKLVCPKCGKVYD